MLVNKRQNMDMTDEHLDLQASREREGGGGAFQPTRGRERGAPSNERERGA
jgi:hypothetical protein